MVENSFNVRFECRRETDWESRFEGFKLNIVWVRKILKTVTGSEGSWKELPEKRETFLEGPLICICF